MAAFDQRGQTGGTQHNDDATPSVDWRKEALEGANIIDELLALFQLSDEDYNAIDRALLHLVRSDAGKSTPRTVAVAAALRKRGYAS